MAWAPDGRLFVAEERGKLWVVKDGAILPDPFLEVTVDSEGDAGLLGVAFDPDFENNQYVYIVYTTPFPEPHNVVSRFTADGDVAAEGSEEVILELENLRAIYHHGGGLHFGPDGKLYVTTGENTVKPNAQTLSNRLGKMLRINSDGTIPEDNPFYETAEGDNRAIWALGLRNPFTFAFQPGTGRMFINDVGEGRFEEVNDVTAGANLGWPDTEGYHDDPRYVSPVYAYPHSNDTDECAVIGGAFYNPETPTFPREYVGRYFFADHCAGWIRTLDPENGYAIEDFAQGLDLPVTINVGPDGALYALTRGPFGTPSGSVHRFYWAATDPVITAQPKSQQIPEGAPVTFTVDASSNEPLNYQWQRDGVDIPEATASSYTIPEVQIADEGAVFRALVSDPDGNVLSDPATLDVTIGSAPTAIWMNPSEGATYGSGDILAYSATATDPEDGDLGPEAFTWWVDFHHNTHSHEAVPIHSGTGGGSYEVPLRNETDTDVFYRFNLRVTDSDGNAIHVSRDVQPRLSTLGLATSPVGLALQLDGAPQLTPHSFASVEGQQRTLGTPVLQSLAGAPWRFDSWSDGGARTHDVFVPTADQTYTAVHRVAAGAVGTGTGLRGTYFNNQDFTGSSTTRLDRTINFSWGAGSPAPQVEPDTFSARWVGRVQPQFTGIHTFTVLSDAGARLWVNGQRLVNHWGPHRALEASGSINLIAGRKYQIQLAYRETTGDASLSLYWQGPSIPLKSVIPGSQLMSP